MSYNNKRKSNFRSYKKFVFLITEGTKTEPQYFSMQWFKDNNKENYVLRIIKHNNVSSPIGLIKLAESKKRIASKQDIIWIVLDKDSWTLEQFNKLHTWAQKGGNRYSLSNPSFEYWLLLHFEDGKAINSQTTCLNRLKKHLCNYEKNNININDFPISRIKQAIKRAHKQFKYFKEDPFNYHGTGVHKLVELFISENNV